MKQKPPDTTDSIDAVPPLRLEWRDPSELTEHPSNWRGHPETQTRALRDLVGEVGWAGALLYNERTSRLLDGHARRKLGTDPVPVLIGNWSEAQELLILATLDPIGSMAQADYQTAATVAAQVQADATTRSESLSALLSDLSLEAEIAAAMAQAEIASSAIAGDSDIQIGQDGRQTFRPVLVVTEAAKLEQAIAATGEASRATALMVLCDAFLQSRA
jgi:hypothetical protein